MCGMWCVVCGVVGVVGCVGWCGVVWWVLQENAEREGCVSEPRLCLCSVLRT